jgi:hypothetical protein
VVCCTLGGNRTHTPRNTSLSRARLPIPPPRHKRMAKINKLLQIVSNSFPHFCKKVLLNFTFVPN